MGFSKFGKSSIVLVVVVVVVVVVRRVAGYKKKGMEAAVHIATVVTEAP